MRVPPGLLRNLLGLAALTALLAACFGGDDPDERVGAATPTAQSSPSTSPVTQTPLPELPADLVGRPIVASPWPSDDGRLIREQEGA